jgi:hypothetical protein
MGEFRLPKKKSSEFPRRRTLSMSESMDNKLHKLSEAGFDVPELMRSAIEKILESDGVKSVLVGS